MDGIDIVHLHYTQERPDAPLKVQLLHEGEIEFDGELKSKSSSREFDGHVY